MLIVVGVLKKMIFETHSTGRNEMQCQGMLEARGATHRIETFAMRQTGFESGAGTGDSIAHGVRAVASRATHKRQRRCRRTVDEGEVM